MRIRNRKAATEELKLPKVCSATVWRGEHMFFRRWQRDKWWRQKAKKCRRRKPERRVRNAVREEGVSDRIADDLRIIQIVILTKIASAKPRIYNRLQAFAARFNDTKQNNFGARRDNFSAVLILQRRGWYRPAPFFRSCGPWRRRCPAFSFQCYRQPLPCSSSD